MYSCQLRAAVITVIFNNTVLGMVRQWQTAFYGKRYSSTDPHRKTNYVKLAEGFWRERLSLRDAGCVFGGVCRSAEIERAGVD